MQKKPSPRLLGAKSIAGARNTYARGTFEDTHQLTPRVREDQPVRAARCILATGRGRSAQTGENRAGGFRAEPQADRG